jgi:periplasmic protein TonB
MESKKSTKVDLENKKNLFFLFGLVVALSVTLFAFEWTSKPSSMSSLGKIQAQEVEEEFIPVTRQEEVKPPPPPAVKTIEILNIVADNVRIDEELNIEDSEADNQTLIDITPVIQTTAEKKEEEAEVFYFAEEMPEFPGGDKALYSFLGNNVKYPVIAQENGIQGRVFLKFVVGTDGSVSNIEIVRGVDSSLDSEAIRLIKSLPKFKPGKQRGRPVRVFYNTSINFKLNY